MEVENLEFKTQDILDENRRVKMGKHNIIVCTFYRNKKLENK